MSAPPDAAGRSHPVETHVFDRLARLTTRWPKTIIGVALVFIALCLLYGVKVTNGLQTGGETNPSSQSAQAEALLTQKFAAGQPNLVLLVSSPSGVDNPSVAAEGQALAAKLSAHSQLVGVSSYWSTHSPLMRARDGKSAVIIGYIEGKENQQRDFINAVGPTVDGKQGPVTVQLGGTAVVQKVQVGQVRQDIADAEKFGIPLTALVMILAFQSFVASLLPLVVGLIAVLGTLAELRLLSTFTDVSVFSLNLATGLSTGLAADYGLFIVKRYRDEFHAGVPIPEAVRITLNTAGRTVMYSSLTVAVAMSSMLVFPLYFLRSFAYAGIAVVLLAASAALIALPAGLVLLGPHVDDMDLGKIPARLLRRGGGGSSAPRPTVERANGWQRVAEAVMRRPLMYAATTTALLVVLIVPFLHVSFGMPDDRVLPASTESHVVQQTLRDDYDGQITNNLEVVADKINPAAQSAGIDAYAKRLSTVPGVVRVSAVTGIYADGRQVSPAGPATAGFATSDATYLTVASSDDRVSSAGKTQVADVRAVPAPFPVLVGGANADLVDALHGLGADLPWAMLIIVVASMSLIFLLTGGVLIALKALLMNVIGLTATFGALVWVFQYDHFRTLLGFQHTGWLDVSLLVLLFAVAFGVSMDFEVFLLSRIKEEYKRTGDNRAAVAFGIAKTGSVVTAAAAITSVVFLAIGLTAHVSTIKMFGWGLGLALIMDATVIRSILVPALMRLAGKYNWWRPAFTNGFYERFKLHDENETERKMDIARTDALLDTRPTVTARDGE
jgi:RND superfamily putative drug exporter